jgi:intracellular septation protein
MHVIFEYIPLITFFIVNKFYDIYWATGALIVTSGFQILYYLVKKEKVPTRHWVVLGLLVFFGGLTIFFHNDAFIKWKVTVINELFALVLLISHYGFKNNLMKKLLKKNLPELPNKVWEKLNLAWACFFAVCGLVNYYVAFNFELETWVNFKVFGLTGLTFAFTILSMLSLYRYFPQDEEETNVCEDKIQQESAMKQQNIVSDAKTLDSKKNTIVSSNDMLNK